MWQRLGELLKYPAAAFTIVVQFERTP